MSNFTGCDELREWLVENGFRIYSDECRAPDECDWYACRHIELPARDCECNEGKKLQLVVRPFQYKKVCDEKWESSEVSIFGETSGMWFQLTCYSLAHDVLRARLADIERMLVAAWNAMEAKK